MPRDKSAGPGRWSQNSRAQRPVPKRRGPAGPNQRIDPRSTLAVQAIVEMPGMASRAYSVSEISRGGMFLMFRDCRSTMLEFEQQKIEPGTSVDIAFALALTDTKHRLRVHARLARITKQGIGVEFTTHNPPQLAALRELFAKADQRRVSDTAQESQRGARGHRRISNSLIAPAAPPDWDLAD